jgi:hypothetical protein
MPPAGTEVNHAFCQGKTQKLNLKLFPALHFMNLQNEQLTAIVKLNKK